MRVSHDGIDYGISFNIESVTQVESVAQVDWEKPKLWINNSFLCIFSDGFMTFLWALFLNQDPKKCSEINIIGVRSPVDGNEVIE